MHSGAGTSNELKRTEIVKLVVRRPDSGSSMSSSADSKKVRKATSTLAKNYLVLYNSIETLGWSYILYLFVNHHLHPTEKPLYKVVEAPLIIFQNAAVLEVVHAIIRLVPSNPLITAMQIASRVIVVSGVLMVTQLARETVGLHLILFAWSITEIIRYGNYTLNLLGAVPHFVTWLRYTTFIVLYPIGVTGELLCVYAAQKEIRETRIWTIDMPNRLNFIFDYQKLLWVIMLLYIPILPKLYMHMFSLRKKVLGGAVHKKVQ